MREPEPYSNQSPPVGGYEPGELPLLHPRYYEKKNNIIFHQSFLANKVNISNKNHLFTQYTHHSQVDNLTKKLFAFSIILLYICEKLINKQINIKK